MNFSASSRRMTGMEIFKTTIHWDQRRGVTWKMSWGAQKSSSEILRHTSQTRTEVGHMIKECFCSIPRCSESSHWTRTDTRQNSPAEAQYRGLGSGGTERGWWLPAARCWPREASSAGTGSRTNCWRDEGTHQNKLIQSYWQKAASTLDDCFFHSVAYIQHGLQNRI